MKIRGYLENAERRMKKIKVGSREKYPGYVSGFVRNKVDGNRVESRGRFFSCSLLRYEERKKKSSSSLGRMFTVEIAPLHSGDRKKTTVLMLCGRGCPKLRIGK